MPKILKKVMVQKMTEIHYHCEEIEPIIYLYIDNEINDITKTHAIEVHFQECVDCQAIYKQEREFLSAIKRLLNAACTEQAPEFLKQEILKQLDIICDTEECSDLLFSQVSYAHTFVYHTVQTIITSNEMGQFVIQSIDEISTGVLTIVEIQEAQIHINNKTLNKNLLN